MLRINGSKAQYHTARRTEAFVAALYQRNDGFIRARFENGNRRFRGVCSFFAMPNSVHRRDQDSISRYSKPDGDRPIHPDPGE